MKLYLFILFLLPFLLFSQEQDSTIVKTPDVMPEFPGGSSEMNLFLENNFQFPDTISPERANGRIFVKFIVDIDGTIDSVEILRGLTKELDNEALRVIRSMPNWTPALINGKKTKSIMRYPIKIELK